MYHVENYLWIGPIPPKIIAQFNLSSLNFGGQDEQIYDQFELVPQGGMLDFDRFSTINVPDDIPHLLSQLGTSRYIPCRPGQPEAWFGKHEVDQGKINDTVVDTIVKSMKELARREKIQVWIFSGTLLGKLFFF